MSLNTMKANNKTNPSASRYFGFAALSLSLTATGVFAQSPEAEMENGDPEVVDLPGYVAQGSQLYTDQINALKTPTPIINVPQSLTITQSEEIALRGFDLGDDTVP